MRPKRNRAFTLVELLCVIAILAVLIAIMVPSLSRIRDRAGVATCAASHRATFDLMATYAGEYKEYPGYDVNLSYRWWYERSFSNATPLYDPNHGGFWYIPPNSGVLAADPPSIDLIPEAESGGFLSDKNDPGWAGYPGVPYGMFLKAGLIGNSANEWARFQCPTRPHIAVICDANIPQLRNGNLRCGSWQAPRTYTYEPNEVLNFGNGLWFGYNGPNVSARAAKAKNQTFPGTTSPGPIGPNPGGFWNDAGDGALFILGGQSGVCGGGQAAGQTWGISLRDAGRHFGNSAGQTINIHGVNTTFCYRPNGWYSVSDFAFLGCPGLSYEVPATGATSPREPHMGQELNNGIALDRNFTFGDGHTTYLSRADRRMFTLSDKP